MGEPMAKKKKPKLMGRTAIDFESKPDVMAVGHSWVKENKLMVPQWVVLCSWARKHQTTRLAIPVPSEEAGRRICRRIVTMRKDFVVLKRATIAQWKH